MLTCFKVYPDWSADSYIEKLIHLFKRYNLDRNKVFSVVTNLKARQFQNAIDTYIGANKRLFCLIHQLNCKFNELLLNCDYEEDKVHYEEKLEELMDANEIDANQQLNSNGEEENRFSDDDFDMEEKKEEVEISDGLALEDEEVENNNELALEDEDSAEEEDSELAYVKLDEEAKDVLEALSKQKLNEMPDTIRVTKSLIKTFAFISSNKELQKELDNKTKKKNGHDFQLIYLLSYNNWNYLYQFIFYFKMIKNDLLEFLGERKQIPFELDEHDLEIIDDLFDLLACLIKKLNFLSLEEDIGLGKVLNIMKYFINSLERLNLKTKEAEQLKCKLLAFFQDKHGIFERDLFYGIASLLDPKCTKYDFRNDYTFKQALTNLHETLCFRLDKNFNLTLFRIRAPLRIEIENFHKDRPYRGCNDLTKFQMTSPVLQEVVYDYFTLSAICFEPKKIDYAIKAAVNESLSQVRSDVLSKVLLLNSLDKDVIDKIIDHSKFWY